MPFEYLVSMLIVITALASYINSRFIKLPKSIGLTILTLGLSLVIMILLSIGQLWVLPLKKYLSGINFGAMVMQGMLSYLLFAGGLQINALKLKDYKFVVIFLATLCVGISTVVIGVVTHYLVGAFGLDLSWLYCFLFGAIISPTDPVCVMGIVKRTPLPESIRMQITGEALFNDAVSIFMFVILSQLLTGQLLKLDTVSTTTLLIREGFGGITLGLVLAVFASHFLRRSRSHETAILITLAIVTGGYSLATLIHVSGPMAMVVAGLYIGARCQKPHFSHKTVDQLYAFWELVEDLLNSFLFVMIGLEVLSINVPVMTLLIGLIAFFVVSGSRFVSLIVPTAIVSAIKMKVPDFKPLTIMTWAGMRGGVSIALALSLPETDLHSKDIIISICYVVVILSIIVQGLSLEPLINFIYSKKKKTS